MFICLDCGKIFESTKHYVETHGLNHPHYEEWDGCPLCGGAYANTYKCDECGRWIAGEYIKTVSGQRICERCHDTIEIGDED